MRINDQDSAGSVKIDFPAIYPITDTAISGLTIREQVERMIAGGAGVIQIREKKAPSRELFEAAKEALELARRHGVRVIVNDRVDIAVVLKSDGVHLGQEDLSPVHARRLLGDEAVIGYSTHTLEQAADAVRLPIDYLAFGPVFPTSTKENPDAVVGLEVLEQVKSIAGGLPLIAIGGINAANLEQVLDAGADSAAIINGILSGPAGIEMNMRLLSGVANRRNKNV